MEFLQRLADKRTIVLDGATGTELERRGVSTGLPMWSANALLSTDGRRILEEIHAAYVRAGAEIITTNTFRTHRRALASSGNANRAQELTQKAVESARSAIDRHGGDTPRFVAGSISTLEDCYRPDLVPIEAECRAEHSERIHHLIESGVDLLLIETMNTVREAVIAAKLAVITGTPVAVSFVCLDDGRIMSGETIIEAAAELIPLGVVALGVNCVPVANMRPPLSQLHDAAGDNLPLMAYANIGHADDARGWINTDTVPPDEYVRTAEDWPARIVGGCCGTTPAHIAALAEVEH